MPSTAVRWAGRVRPWGKWGVPARTPPIGSGPIAGPNDPIGLTVELYLGALGWTDISPYVLYRDSSVLVTITRGRPNETSTPQPQTASLQVNNRDSRFSPRNPTGPHYQLLGRNTPLRISRMQNGVRRYRFVGEVVSWPTNADVSGQDVWVPLDVAGQLRRLTQGTAAVLSAMRRAYTKSAVVPSVVAYWPCEDTAGAALIGSATPNGIPMTFSGPTTFASNSAFACSQAIPVLNGSKWTGTVPGGITWQDNVLRFLIQIPAGGDNNGAVIARMNTSGTVAQMELYYTTAGGGSLNFRGFNIAGTQLWNTTGILDAGGAGWNGTRFRGSLSLQKSGTGVLYQFAALDVGANTPGTSNATLAASSVGAVTSIQIAPNGNLAGTALGHVSVQNVWDDLADVINPLNAWNFDSATGRLSRLYAEEGVNQVVVGTYDPAQDPTLMGNQSPATYLDLISQCTAVDMGVLFEARDQLAVAYRPLSTLYNQGTAYAKGGSVLKLDWAQHQLSAQPVPQDDDYYTKNDVTVSQTAGTSARSVLLTGPMSIQPPPAGAGPYGTAVTLNTGPDNFFFGETGTADYAGWLRHLGTIDEPRYPSVSVNLRHPQFTGNLTLMNAAIVLDIGDVIEIDNAPGRLSADPIRLVVQGYSESLGIWEHDITFVCSPESPYRVAVVEDAVLGRADLDGSTLAAPVGAPDTLLSLATLAGTPPWTVDPAAFPFDLRIAGERVTVACPGTQIGPDPFLAQGLAQYAGFNASVALDPSRPWPTNANGILNPYAAQTIAVAPTGGFASVDVHTMNSAAGTVTPGVSYDGWAWVFNTTGRPLEAFINWLNAGSYLSTSFGASTTVPAGLWTLVRVTATAPASANMLAVGATDVGTPTSAQTFNAWGLNATASASLSQASPQQYSVIRAVNGVSKSQVAGASVALWQPMILSI